MKKSIPFLVLLALCAGANAADHWDGSRTVPLHRLPIFDEDGQRIIPLGKNCAPLSQRQSCNTCHNYQTIGQGWHFNAGATDKNGRPGEPWVLQDAVTGTQLPLSWRGGKGVWKPDQVGMDAWQFTKEFARSLPGGGVSEPADLFTPGARWNVSGPLEINCLACHNQAPVQDMSEWARQVSRENYRWAATAAAGLGEVGGMAARMGDLWTPDRRPNPDDSTYKVPPNVEYDAKAFDLKNRVVFDVGRPQDRNCLACHSVGHSGKARTEIAGDIHTRAGLSCVDCHRNGLDHRITRGYEGEAKERDEHSATAMSCRGCHMGSDASVGRFGAQRPAHVGLPPVHLEKLSCTACHSGNAPAGTGPELVRTSRANRLGIHGRAIWDTELPLITEPVFAPGHDGKIAPHRALWPAFWARVTKEGASEQLKPLLPEAALALAGDAMRPGQTIAEVLTKLAALPDAPGIPVLAVGAQALKIKTDLVLEVVAAKDVPAGKPQWGFVAGGVFAPLVPAGDAAKDRLDSLLKILTNAGIVDPVVTMGEKFFRIKPSNSDIITGTATADTPALGRFVKDQVVPLVADLEALAASCLSTAGTTATIDAAQMTRALKAMKAKEAGAEFAYVANGRVHRLGADGALVSATHAQAEPTLWPLGHDVRPAQQALGAKGCTECHTLGAPFFAAPVAAQGPLAGAAPAKPMVAYAGFDAVYAEAFALSFMARPFFKAFLFVVAGGMLLAMLLAAARSRMPVVAAVGATCGARFLLPVVMLTVALVVGLALTGFVPFLTGGALSGWMLMAHNMLGGGFAAGLAAMACLGLCLQSSSSGQSRWRWLMVATGTAAILSAVTMMIPWQGTEGQHTLVVVHRIAAALAVVAGLGTVFSGGAKNAAA